MSRISRVGHNFLKSDNFIYTFLRAGAVSQAASWIDLFIGFALFAWAHADPALATAAGAVAGGIINCYVNFHFSFHAKGQSWRAVIVKYVMVWIGSILINSFGTKALYNLLQHWPWLETIGFRPDGYYTAARLAVSGVTSLFWNLLLQAIFVYKITRFDATAIKIANIFLKPISLLKNVRNH